MGHRLIKNKMLTTLNLGRNQERDVRLGHVMQYVRLGHVMRYVRLGHVMQYDPNGLK